MPKLKLTPTKVFRTKPLGGKPRERRPLQSAQQMFDAVRRFMAAAAGDDAGLSRMKVWADATFMPVKRAIDAGECIDRDSVEWHARMVRLCASEAERAVKTGDAKTALREGLKAASHYWIGAVVEQRHGANIVTGKRVRNRRRVDGIDGKLLAGFAEIKRDWPRGKKFKQAEAHRRLAERFGMEESAVKKRLQRHG